jgi:hypothetical protein
MTPSKVKPVPQPTATATVVTVVTADAGVAANDESASTVVNDLRNPLWIIAIGMAWFFGITAAVIALS